LKSKSKNQNAKQQCKIQNFFRFGFCYLILLISPRPQRALR